MGFPSLNLLSTDQIVVIPSSFAGLISRWRLFPIMMVFLGFEFRSCVILVKLILEGLFSCVSSDVRIFLK